MRQTSGILSLLFSLLSHAQAASDGSVDSSTDARSVWQPVAPIVDNPLNLPEHFQRLIENRAIIDSYQQRRYQAEPGIPPVAVAPTMSRRRVPNGIRIHESEMSPATGVYRAALPKFYLPRRGFRAPILGESESWSDLPELTRLARPEYQAAAELIHRRLAHDGLLATLAQTIQLLGPDQFTTTGVTGLRQLRAVGFPDDLLAGFAQQKHVDPDEASLEVLQEIAHGVQEGKAADLIRSRFQSRDFKLPLAAFPFEIAPESGGQPIGFLRLQVGGGFADGIVPGDSIDVIGQLIAGLPKSNFLLMVPAELRNPINAWARQSLPLVRPQQLVMVTSPLHVEAWAQDNGKAGVVRDPITGTPTWATMAPRYASREEGASMFLPSESFLMDGLQSSGHHVLHFPLLFQGGNLLPVTHPKTGRRILLIGEGEIHRNVTLGLTREQVVETFRRGFGVDECLPMPGLSYHLDFDVCIREINGELTAFVNDPLGAARAILGLGVDTFERHGLLDRGTAIALHYDLNGERPELALHRLSEIVNAGRNAEGMFGMATAAMFKSSGVDSAEGNLGIFLQALDLVEISLTISGEEPVDSERVIYLRSLRAMDNARLAQVAALKSLGGRIALVPSMPNLYRSINYLNGIHHRAGYVMPASGGFYAPLDAVAEQVFRDTIGEPTSILRIHCAALQRKQGAIHCAAAAYPALSPILQLQVDSGF